MAVSNVSVKNLNIVPGKKVEESFNSARDREGSNFYQKEEKERKLPEDLKELFSLISEEVKKFIKRPNIVEQGVNYRAIKIEKEVFVVATNYKGDELRRIPAVEFLRICASSSGSKGNILNSVF